MTTGGHLPDERLGEWLAEHGVALAPPVRSELISGGRSNLTYAVIGADGRRVVLRRPPFDGVLETAHDMGREWAFISALRPTPVPVADALAMADTTELIGAPFYIMGFVDGLVLHDAGAAATLAVDARPAAAASLVDTMTLLHRVDIDDVGLGGIAKREDYIGRQLRRWRRQWVQSVCADLAIVGEVHDRLAAAVPPQRRTGIVHGDFRLGNMICGPDGTIRAVLDWELATLGDPLADLGWLLSSWPSAGEWSGAPDAAPPSVLPGFPDREWITERYASGSGQDVSDIGFYVAFAYWRGACISAGVLTRYSSGAMGDDGFDSRDLRSVVELRAQQALDTLVGR